MPRSKKVLSPLDAVLGELQQVRVGVAPRLRGFLGDLIWPALLSSLAGGVGGGLVSLVTVFPVLALAGGLDGNGDPTTAAGWVAAVVPPALGVLAAVTALSVSLTKDFEAKRRATQVAPAAALVVKSIDELIARLRRVLTDADLDEPSLTLASTLTTTRESFVQGFSELWVVNGDADLPAYAQARELASELEALLDGFEEAQARKVLEVAEVESAARAAGMDTTSFSRLLEDSREHVSSTRRLLEDNAALEEAARAEVREHLTRVRASTGTTSPTSLA
jgi:hypothetical protein